MFNLKTCEIILYIFYIDICIYISVTIKRFIRKIYYFCVLYYIRNIYSDFSIEPYPTHIKSKSVSSQYFHLSFVYL